MDLNSDDISNKLYVIRQRLMSGKVEKAINYNNDIEFLFNLLAIKEDNIFEIESFNKKVALNMQSHDVLVKILSILGKYGYLSGPE